MTHIESTKNLLKGYSSRELAADDRAILISGLRAWYRSPDRDRFHGRCFEVILNRYIIIHPMKLTQVGEIYGLSENNAGRDVREGIQLLSKHLPQPLPALTGS